jgi:hypothetical protein
MEILKYNPCKDAVEFRSKFETFEDAWNACERGDWMFWIAQKVGVDIRTMTLAKGLCAETVIHLMQDERSKKAVYAAIAFGRGEIDEEDLQLAAAAALAAAAYATATAAYAYAAAYAAAAAASGYAASTASTSYADTAKICREILTESVLEKIKTTKQ